MKSNPTGTPTLNPQAMTFADAAQLLAKVSGEKITPAMTEADRNAGAPTNPDGTLHLVHYSAWLVKHSGEPDGE